MKKAILSLLAVVAAMGCSNVSNATSGENVAPASAVPAKGKATLTSYDLAALELHGKVKKIVWAEQGESFTAEFDRNGTMTFMADSHGEYMLSHNDDGCLCAYATGAGSSVYSIDPEHDRLSCMSGGEGSTSWVHTYRYDNKGALASVEHHLEDEAEGTNSTTLYTVKYVNHDHHNNWLQRRIADAKDNSINTTRQIIYYDEPVDKTITWDREFRPFSRSYHFEGLIGGNDGCTLDIEGSMGTYTVGTVARQLQVDTYDDFMGTLVMQAWLGGKHIGTFRGVYVKDRNTLRQGYYSGTFTNVNGGKVDFTLEHK